MIDNLKRYHYSLDHKEMVYNEMRFRSLAQTGSLKEYIREFEECLLLLGYDRHTEEVIAMHFFCEPQTTYQMAYEPQNEKNIYTSQI